MNDETSPQTVKRWDSLGHVELFVALEAAFGVRFTPAEVMSSWSVRAIRSALARHQGATAGVPEVGRPGTVDLRKAPKPERRAVQEHDVAVVTGASRGIGAAIARGLARNGFRVVVNYLSSKERAEELVQTIESDGGRALACRADIREEDGAVDLIETAARAFGPVSVLVNNAAGRIRTVPFKELRWDDFQADLDTHLRGTFYCCRAVVPAMTGTGYGKIINIGSAYAMGVPPRHLLHYVSAKAALIGFSKSLAVELGQHGISVNVVLPSITLTDQTSHLPSRFMELEAGQTPMQRLAVPDDVAEAVLMLTMERSNFITGAVIPVTGGRAMP